MQLYSYEAIQIWDNGETTIHRYGIVQAKDRETAELLVRKKYGMSTVKYVTLSETFAVETDHIG